MDTRIANRERRGFVTGRGRGEATSIFNETQMARKASDGVIESNTDRNKGGRMGGRGKQGRTEVDSQESIERAGIRHTC